jgi:hypothetical protein
MTAPKDEIDKRLADAISKAESMAYNDDIEMGEILQDLEEARSLLKQLATSEGSDQDSET